jgi:hypothetical protein
LRPDRILVMLRGVDRRGQMVRGLLALTLLVAYGFACEALTDPAAVSPWAAGSVAGVAGVVVAAMAIALVAPRGSTWSIHQRDVQGLVAGLAIVLSGLAYGAAYLDERAIDELPPPKMISLTVSEAVTTAHEDSDTAPQDSFGEHTVTLLASIDSCDEPVKLRAAFWPRGKKSVSGSFAWTGRKLVPGADAEEVVANPEDGGRTDVPEALVSNVTKQGSASRDEPAIAEFDALAAVQRNGRHGCFVRLPVVSGKLVKPDGEETKVGRYIISVQTHPRLRVVGEKSSPAPVTTTSGQAAWLCGAKTARICSDPVAGVDHVRSEARVNLTLILLGAWIGLGFAIVVEVALAKFGVRPGD